MTHKSGQITSLLQQWQCLDAIRVVAAYGQHLIRIAVCGADGKASQAGYGVAGVARYE